MASIGLETTLAIASGFLPGAGLYEAFNSVQVIASGKGGFFDALNIAAAAFPVAKGLMGLKGLFKARKFRRMACNCFVAGTMVDTPAGAVPLEGLEEGDEVITRPQGCPDCPPVSGTVTRVFKSLAPAILWLTLAGGDVIGATPGHEVWTHQDGWGVARGLTVGDTFTDAAGNPVEIVDIHLDPTPTPVYNLEVDGTFTYFAQGVWVHNNSCPRILPFDGRHHGGALHDAFLHFRLRNLRQQPGVTGLRMDQALVSPGGQKLTNLRPDIQYIRRGKVHIEEIIVTRRVTGRRKTFEGILGGHFGSYIEIDP
ncbi:MAG: Hint domain-containing protein [Planctomycetes bacterium]|nr:Hint domain-containing protein [Planctomycetota bacterium]